MIRKKVYFPKHTENVTATMKSPLPLPPGKTDEGKQWPQILASLFATVAVFCTGFHTGWPAPSLPKLLSNEFPHNVTNEEASYITIIGHVGNICGGLSGTVILDRIGRKKSILLIALPQLVSFLLIVISYQVLDLLYVARFIGGIAEGMTFTIVPLYIAEIAHPKIRGTLGTFIPMICILGMLYVNVAGSYLSIKTTALSILAFPVLFVGLFWKMPESPYFLLMKNRHEEAEESLKFLRKNSNVGEELMSLTKDVNRQMSESGTFRDIFTIDSNRKAFFMIIGARAFQQLTGISAFSLYIQILLAEATDSLPPHIGATLLLIVQLIMSVLSSFFVDRYGRRPLLIFSIGGCFLDLLVQTIYFGIKEYTNIDISVIDWFPLVLMILFIILFSIGLGVAINILNSEIFSASIKSKTVSLVNVVFAAGMLISTKFYQITADTYGLTVPYSSFAFFSFLGVLFFYFCLPETKGRTLEEIQQDLKGNKNVNATEKKVKMTEHA